jgi:hypothetical protein
MGRTSIIGVLRLRLTQKARQPPLRMTGFCGEINDFHLIHMWIPPSALKEESPATSIVAGPLLKMSGSITRHSSPDQDA